MAMIWRSPSSLWLLLAVLALGWLLVRWLRGRTALLAGFAEPALVARLTPDVDPRRRLWRIGLRVAALAVLVVAIAGPRWGFHWQEVHREGIDLIVAIDTSRSMLATDVKPNRLERAKLAVLDLVQLLHGDRIGLVAFAGTAFLECPLTLDYAAFSQSLRSLNVGIIPRGGTALERAIDAGMAGFEARQGQHEALILITDGEDHEGKAEEAAKRAAERGVKVYTVGIGTIEGELVPLGAGAQGFVKDRKGQVVKSRLDEEGLKAIAVATGGAYVRGLGTALGLDEVFRDHIAKMEKRELESTLQRQYEDRFQIPLAIAVLLLLFESFVGERKPVRGAARRWPWRRRGSGAATVASDWRIAVVLLLLMPGLVGWFDPPGDRAAEGNRLYDAGKYDDAAVKYGDGLVDAPDSPLLQFNRAAALYKQEKYSDAIASLTKVAASGDPAWAARAAFNLGNAYYRLGANAADKEPQTAIASYEQALAAYRRAMGADPSDPDPKYNHELVTQKLAELKKKLEEQQKEEQEKEQQKEQQKKEEEQKEQQEQQQDEQQEDQQEQQDQQEKQDDQQGKPEEQPQQDQGEQGEQEQQPQPSEEQKQDQTDQQQAGGDQPQPDAEPQQQPPSSAQAAQESDDEPSPEQKAAQAVLDTARSEELGPEDVRRPVGTVLDVDPAQDW